MPSAYNSSSNILSPKSLDLSLAIEELIRTKSTTSKNRYGDELPRAEAGTRIIGNAAANLPCLEGVRSSDVLGVSRHPTALDA